MLYAVLRQESQGAFAGAAIPTVGSPATAVDQYRIAGIVQNSLSGTSVAFVDVDAVEAIAKIGAGGIAHAREIAAAETALQALLLHDTVHVVVPSPKIQYENGLTAYLRTDQDQRSELGYALLRLANSHDWLIAPERVSLANGKVVQSTLKESPLDGLNAEQLNNRAFDYLTPHVLDAISGTTLEHGVTTYFAEPRLAKLHHKTNFARHFYHRMGISWRKHTGGVPGIVTRVHLPPLLAIVLDRMENRNKLVATVAELRTELAPARRELLELNELVLSASGQAHVEARVLHIEQAFDAIVPESRLSRAERNRRSFATVYPLIAAIPRFLHGLVAHGGVSLTDIRTAALDVERAVFNDSSIVERTVTSRTFRDLVKTDALQNLVRHHFADAELAAIERTLDHD